GSSLASNTQIIFDGAPLATTLTTTGVPVNVVGATGGVMVVTQTMPALQATIGAGSLAVAHQASVVVRTKGPGETLESAPYTFSVGSTAPVISNFGILPSPLIAGNPGFTTTIT